MHPHHPHHAGPYGRGHYPPNPFDAQSLGAFASSLGSLPAEESRKVFFCGCKRTQGVPTCDGSHNTI